MFGKLHRSFPGFYLSKMLRLRLTAVVEFPVRRQHGVLGEAAEGRVREVNEMSSTRVSHHYHVPLTGPLSPLQHHGGDFWAMLG